MRTYSPDRWVILKTSDAAGEYFKVLGSWYGGFGGSDEWKLSSGILDAIKTEHGWEFPQESGSLYRCHKDAYGMSNYTSSVLCGWQEQLKDATVGSLEVMDENFDIASLAKK
jgi:hypothetical protein